MGPATARATMDAVPSPCTLPGDGSAMSGNSSTVSTHSDPNMASPTPNVVTPTPISHASPSTSEVNDLTGLSPLLSSDSVISSDFISKSKTSPSFEDIKASVNTNELNHVNCTYHSHTESVKDSALYNSVKHRAMSNNKRSQVLFNNSYSSVSDHEIKSITELCREDLTDMSNVILSECLTSLRQKEDQIKHFSPLNGVSIYKNHCYIFDEYYLCVGFDYCSIFSYLLLADCCFEDIIVAEVFSQTQDYLYYVEDAKDDLLLCEYIPNKDILQSFFY